MASEQLHQIGVELKYVELGVKYHEMRFAELEAELAATVLQVIYALQGGE